MRREFFEGDIFMAKKMHGDIIDFAEAVLDGDVDYRDAVSAYRQVKEQVDAIGCDIPEYIQVCLRKRGVDIDPDIVFQIFLLGGIDFAASRK